MIFLLVFSFSYIASRAFLSELWFSFFSVQQGWGLSLLLVFTKVEIIQCFFVSQLLSTLDQFFCPQNTDLDEGVDEGVVCPKTLQPLRKKKNRPREQGSEGD